MKAIINAVHKLTGRKPNTLLEVRAELISFLTKHDAADLALDDDIEMLFEMCTIYSKIPVEDLVTADVIKELHEPDLYKRVGTRLTPLLRQTDKKAVEKLAEIIVGLHPDLQFEFSKHGVSFIDNVNVVFSFTHLRSIEDMPNEYSGIVTFPRIKTPEDRDQLIPQNYLEDKKWIFKTVRDRYIRLEGRYLTMTEVMDLLLNRAIITHGNYR